MANPLDYENDEIAKTLKCDWKKCRECCAESHRAKGWYEKFITGRWSLAFTTGVCCPDIHHKTGIVNLHHDMANPAPDYCPHKEYHKEFSEKNKKEVGKENSF